MLAADYSDADFAVVIDDVVREADMDQFLPYLRGRPTRKVVLVPSLEVALARNLNRTKQIIRSGDPGITHEAALPDACRWVPSRGRLACCRYHRQRSGDRGVRTSRG